MTEKATHTPGNWSTSKGSLTGAVWSGNELIASVYPNAPEDWDGRSEFHRVDEMRANARLIAAAPDLLEALKALFEDYKNLADSGDAGNWKLENLEVGKRALAAIAKAENRP